MSDAMAAAYQSHNSIYQAAKNFVTKQIASQQVKKAEINVGKLDSRLKLSKCNKSLQAFLPNGSRSYGKTTIGVKCDGRKKVMLSNQSLDYRAMISNVEYQNNKIVLSEQCATLLNVHHGDSVRVADFPL